MDVETLIDKNLHAFKALYANKEFYNKLKKICYSIYNANKAAFHRAGVYELRRNDDTGPLRGNENIEYTPAHMELMQECLIKIWSVFKVDQSVSYWLKVAQNHLIEMLRKYNRRCELIDFIYPDSDTAASRKIWNEKKRSSKKNHGRDNLINALNI